MSQKRYLSIKNFDTYQHYKDRNPIWIKLYCSMLENYKFSELPDMTKFHFIGLMLLASRLNNKFPEDEFWLRKQINASSKINLKLLLENGFLVAVKGSRNKTKESLNTSKLLKTQDELDSAILEQEKKCAPVLLSQNRTEENRTEENTTQQNSRARSDDTKDGNGVPCANDLKNSFQEILPVEILSEKKLVKNSTEAKSRFSIEECLRYVESCKAKGDEIRNVRGLANSLHKSGESDAFIFAALYPAQNEKLLAESYGEIIQFSTNPCNVCFGARMANIDGKGHKRCNHCKNEKGQPTGYEPINNGEKEND